MKTLREARLATVKVPGVTIRLARKNRDEIDGIAKMEHEVWGHNAADIARIYSRMHVFPEGSYIAINEMNGKIVGYFCFQLVGDLRDEKNLSWAKVTDNGLIAATHQADGQFIYCVNLSVHHSMNGKNLVAALVTQGYLYMIANRKTGMFGGSRIPMFKAYKQDHPDMSAAEYAELRRGRRLYDYELRVYHEAGLGIVNAKVMPDFFPDEDSLNYGVLVYDENPFRRESAARIAVLINMFLNQEINKLRKEAKR